MKTLALAPWLCLSLACACTMRDPLYCDADEACPLETTCDLSTRTCRQATSLPPDAALTRPTVVWDASECGRPAALTPCPNFTRRDADSACLDGCRDHSDCIAGSACDRKQAGVIGVGNCIDPDQVVTLTAGQTLQDAIDRLGSRTHIRTAQSGLYVERLIIRGRAVVLIGDGAAVIHSGISIGGAATVTLQGLKVAGAAGHGIECSPPTSSSLTVLESTVWGNRGIGITSRGCNVRIERSVVQANSEGGILFDGGNLELVGNLILENGRGNIPRPSASDLAGSDFGGVQLLAGSIRFVNNTVTSNRARNGAVAGVTCCCSFVLQQSQITDNDGPAQVEKCTLDPG